MQALVLQLAQLQLWVPLWSRLVLQQCCCLWEQRLCLQRGRCWCLLVMLHAHIQV